MCWPAASQKLSWSTTMDQVEPSQLSVTTSKLTKLTLLRENGRQCKIGTKWRGIGLIYISLQYLYVKVCVSKSVYLYKGPCSLKVYRFAYAHFLPGIKHDLKTYQHYGRNRYQSKTILNQDLISIGQPTRSQFKIGKTVIS